MRNWSAAYEDHCDRLRDERKNEPDLSPRTLDRETARAQLIELFYASLPEAEIGRAINLLGVVMP